MIPDLPVQIRSVSWREWEFTGLLVSHRFDFNVPHKDFFKHLQIRHFIETLLEKKEICDRRCDDFD